MFIIEMSTFTKSGPGALQNNLKIEATVEEEGTGKFVHILKKIVLLKELWHTHIWR